MAKNQAKLTASDAAWKALDKVWRAKVEYVIGRGVWEKAQMRDGGIEKINPENWAREKEAYLKTGRQIARKLWEKGFLYPTGALPAPQKASKKGRGKPPAELPT